MSERHLLDKNRFTRLIKQIRKEQFSTESECYFALNHIMTYMRHPDEFIKEFRLIIQYATPKLINHQDFVYNETILHRVSRRARCRDYILCLCSSRKINVNAKNYDRRNALFVAVDIMNINPIYLQDVMNILILYGSNVNTSDISGKTIQDVFYNTYYYAYSQRPNRLSIYMYDDLEI